MDDVALQEEMAAALEIESPESEQEKEPQETGQESGQETGQETGQESGQETGQETGQTGQPVTKGQVPTAALQKERAEKRQYREQVQQLQQQLAALAERNKIYEEALTGGKLEQPRNEIPHPEQDPIGYLAYLGNQLQLQQQQQQQYIREQQEQEYVRKLVNSATNSFQAAKQKMPDFDNAINYLCGQIDQTLRASNPEISQEEINTILRNEALEVTRIANERNIDVGDYLYEIAKIRGYTPQPPVGQGIQKARTLTATGGGNLNSEFDISSLNEREAALQARINPDKHEKLMKKYLSY